MSAPRAIQFRAKPYRATSYIISRFARTAFYTAADSLRVFSRDTEPLVQDTRNSAYSGIPELCVPRTTFAPRFAMCFIDLSTSRIASDTAAFSTRVSSRFRVPGTPEHRTGNPNVPSHFAAQRAACVSLAPVPIAFPTIASSSRAVSIRADTSPCICVHYKRHTVRVSRYNPRTRVTALRANRASLAPHFAICYASASTPRRE